MMIRLGVLLLALFNFMTPIADAQTSASTDLSSLNLEQLMNVQFYTASKRAQDVSETPASVSIVTRADIRNYGYRTLADVLQNVRGFWVNSDFNYSYVGVRGLARPGDYNTRVLLLVNGHRMNDDIYEGATIGTEFPLDLDLVERIEIVRGPGSSLYGTDALFGVINVITRQPPISQTIEISGDSGNKGTGKARVTVGLPQILDGAVFSASIDRSVGNGSLYFPSYDSPDTNNGVAQNVDGDLYGSALALVRWKHFQLQALLGSRKKIIPTGSFGTIFNDPGNYTVDTRGFTELSYQRDFASGLQLMSRGFFDAYAYRGSYAYLDPSRVLEYDKAHSYSVGTETQISRPIGHRNTVTAGTEFRYNLVQAQEDGFGTLPPAFGSRQRSNVFGLYGQDEFRIASKILINAGLRFDHYSTFGSTVNPRIAAIYHADQKTALKYTYGQAFRAPNSYETSYSDGFTQEPNSRLSPERIASQDLGVERVLTPTFHIVAEAFYNSLSDMLDEQVDPATGLYHFVNASANRGRGLEFELDAQHGYGRGELSYTVQRSTDLQSKAELANSPQHVAKLNVHVPFAPRLLAGLGVQYLSAQRTPADIKIPDSLTVNPTLSTRKPILGLDWLASCQNLLNRHNYDPPSPALLESRLPQESRGFRIQVTRRISRD